MSDLKFPFVARAKYEAQCREATAAHDRLDSVLGENERLMGLLRLVMRPHRKKEVKPVTPITLPDPTLTPDIHWPIEQRSAGDPALRRYLVNYAQEQVALGKSPDDIAYAIRYGDEGDDE